MGQGAPQWHAYPIMPWENDSAKDWSSRLPAPASRCRFFLCESPAEMPDRTYKVAGPAHRQRLPDQLLVGGVDCGVDSPREITLSAANNPGRSRRLSVSYRNGVGICFLLGTPDKREVGSSTLPRPITLNRLPCLVIFYRAGLLHGPEWGGCVDSLCRLLPAEGLQRLSSLERFPHRRLIGPLVTFENRLRLLPPAEMAQILQRGVLQLRCKLSSEAVPAEPRLVVDLSQLLSPLPPVRD